MQPVINPLRHGHHASSASPRRYTDPGTTAHTAGLSFSVTPEVRPLPGSLLNRALTKAPRKPAALRGKGWEEVTGQAIRALAARGRPLASILWGRDARDLRPLLGDLPSIESAHPSPMSADRGFFGSRPFSRANDLLTRQGGAPAHRRLP